MKTIYRIKHLLDRKMLILLINTFVFSKLFYCSTVWSNNSKTKVKKMQLVQNFAGRILSSWSPEVWSPEGLKSLRWLPIADKLLLNDSVMNHKCLNGRAPVYLDTLVKHLFVDMLIKTDTRYKKDLNLPRCRLKTGPVGSDLSPLEGLLVGTNNPKT